MEVLSMNKKSCSAACRDGSICLNLAREGEYCWLHARKLYVSEEGTI